MAGTHLAAARKLGRPRLLNQDAMATIDMPQRTQSISTASPGKGRSVTAFYIAGFAILILLQKFALPLGEPISVTLPLLYAGLFAGAISLRLQVAPLRLLAFGAFLMAAFGSQLMVGRPFSAPSFLLLLLLYFPLAFVWRPDAARYRKIMGGFQNLMLIAVVTVALQLAWQGIFGLGKNLSIESYVPEALLLPGYIYEAPIFYGASFVRPNGFFFLEPSYVAMFLASAVIIELVLFQRLWRLAAYSLAMIGTMGATGLLMVALALPFVLGHLRARLLLLVLCMLMLAVFGALALGVGDALLSRLEELSRPGSSGWERLVAPLQQLADLSSDPGHLFTGSGAGNVSEFQSSPWPLTKLVSEYGALTALLYLIMMVVSVVDCPIRSLAFAVFMILNFTGGYLLNPVAVGLIFLLVTSLRPSRSVQDSDQHRSSDKRRPSSRRASPSGLAGATVGSSV